MSRQGKPVEGHAAALSQRALACAFYIRSQPKPPSSDSHLLEPRQRCKCLVAIAAQANRNYFFFTFQINKAVSSMLRNRPQNRLFCKITQLNYFQPAERENPFLATFNFLTLFPLSFPNLHPHIWNVILMYSPLSLPERLLASAKTLNPAPTLIETAGWKARGSRGKGVGALLRLPDALNTFPKPGSRPHGSWLLQPTPSGEAGPWGGPPVNMLNCAQRSKPSAFTRRLASGGANKHASGQTMLMTSCCRKEVPESETTTYW